MFFCKNTENGTAENFRHPTNWLQLSHHVVHAVHAGLLIHQERRRTQSARSKHAAVLRAMADADSLARAKEADFMLARDRAAAQGVHPDFLMLALAVASVAAENGFALLPKTIFPRPLCAKTLSVIASAADTDLRVLYVGEG